MSFRIEEKFSIDKNKIIDFKSFLANKTVKQIYQPRRIRSLYFENRNYEMYSDSIEGLTPRKKIRIRNYPDTTDKNLYRSVEYTKLCADTTKIRNDLQWNTSMTFKEIIVSMVKEDMRLEDQND